MLPAPSAVQEWVVNMTFSAVHDVSHLYFVTASIVGWKHLLSKPKYIQIVLDSLVWLQNEKRILLFAFVIMPSHLHMILKPEGATIGDVIRDFGSYTAHVILHELHKDKMQDLLLFFTNKDGMLGMSTVSGRIYKLRISILMRSYPKSWTIFMAILYRKNGGWLRIRLHTNTQVHAFMKMGFLPLSRLQILTNG